MRGNKQYVCLYYTTQSPNTYIIFDKCQSKWASIFFAITQVQALKKEQQKKSGRTKTQNRFSNTSLYLLTFCVWSFTCKSLTQHSLQPFFILTVTLKIMVSNHPVCVVNCEGEGKVNLRSWQKQWMPKEEMEE